LNPDPGFAGAGPAMASGAEPGRNTQLNHLRRK
jgi:hypothetical protein